MSAQGSIVDDIWSAHDQVDWSELGRQKDFKRVHLVLLRASRL